MQSLTRNPLAEPGLLGINSGAAAAIAVGISLFGIVSVTGYLVLGLIGAAAASALVFLLGGVRKGTNPVRLVLSGAALTAVLASLTQIVLLNSPENGYDRYRHWMVGSLAGRGTDVLVAVTALVAVGLVMAYALSRSLDVVSLGEDAGHALGASPNRVWMLAGLVVVLAGAATAGAGPIVFLGLAAPHLARMMVGVDHRWLLPYSAAIASVMITAAHDHRRGRPRSRPRTTGRRRCGCGAGGCRRRHRVLRRHRRRGRADARGPGSRRRHRPHQPARHRHRKKHGDRRSRRRAEDRGRHPGAPTWCPLPWLSTSVARRW